MMPSVPHASIDRVRIRAPAAQTDAAVAGLEQADWPRANEHEWVFVRSVTVCATMPWIGRQAAADVEAKIRAAVPGGVSDASTADAIRFCSLTELLAWLSADLAAGRAAQCWYWRRWMRLFELPAGEALVRLWEEHIDCLPAVIADLAQQGKLVSAWRQLDGPLAKRLTIALAQAHRLSMPDVLPRPQNSRSPVPVTVPGYQQQRWRVPLVGLEARDSRTTLAALLVALETQPTTLLADAWQRVANVADRLVADAMPEDAAPEAAREPYLRETAAQDSIVPTRRIAGRIREPATPRLGQLSRERDERVADERAPAQDRSADSRDKHAPMRIDPPLESTTPGVGGAMQPPAAHREDLATVEPEQNACIEEQPLAYGREFLTHEGGLFYFVNVLCRAEIRELFERLGAWQTVPNGWVWLHALGEAFGLDEAGPLAGFLTEQIAAADGEEFVRPDPGHVAEVVNTARELYTEFDVQIDDLLPLFARICLTESHLDIHMPSSAVSLPVRLAGLDINPGWVDWLGRVVTFHYVEEGSPLLPGAQ